MDQLKTLVKSNQQLFLWSLTAITLLRLLRLRLDSFPQTSGWSKFDFIPRRRILQKIKQAYSPTNPPNPYALIHALETDRERISNIEKTAKRVIPLSFSWPGPMIQPTQSWESRQDFSEVVPGEPYSFGDYHRYLKQYQQSKFALTIKKGGWDCFRHLEILASGAIPVMPDIDQCPEWAMAFYPKAAMSEVTRQVLQNIEIDNSFTGALHSFFIENLTAEAMSRRLLNHVGRPKGRVLFLDPHLNSVPEYLSVMSYVGLKQSLGRERVIAPFGSGPVYQDWNGNPAELHGLGFGYTKILTADMRSSSEEDIDADPLPTLTINQDDLVIVGSLSRNKQLANRVQGLRLRQDQVVYLWGDDRSPNRRELRWLKGLSGYLALRELYGGVKAARYLETNVGIPGYRTQR